MARPKQEGLSYFPLDVDFFEDDKILLLAADGAQAVTVYLKLLCLIYRSDEGLYYRWDETRARLMAVRLPVRTDAAEIQRHVEACLDVGLFDRGLYQRCGVLTSRGIQRRYVTAASAKLRRRLSRGQEVFFPAEMMLLSEEDVYSLLGYSLSDLPAGRVRIADKAQCAAIVQEQTPSCEDVCHEQMQQRKVNKRKENKRREERKEKYTGVPPDAPPAAPPSPAKAFGLVNLSGTDYEGLCARFGQGAVDAKIAHMDAWLRETGRSVRSCAATLNDWLTQDTAQVAPPAGKRTGAHAFTQRTYTDEELDALLYTDLDDLQP